MSRDARDLVCSLTIFCSLSTVKNLRPRRGDLYGRPQDERIVFGVARLEPRSNSASAHVKPGGIEAPQTIPSSSGYTKYPRIRGIGRPRFLAKIAEAIHRLSFKYWEAGMQISVGILTVSDKGSKGERIDKSGQAIREMVEEKLKARVKKYEVVPDEKRTIVEKLKEMVDDRIDLILTTGGTGLSPRDVTPEATMEVIEKEIPGIEEAMRMKGLEKTPHSMLSRGVAGVVKGSLIINLPGSPKGVRESLEVVLPAIPHALDIISGRGGECGKP